ICDLEAWLAARRRRSTSDTPAVQQMFDDNDKPAEEGPLPASSRRPALRLRSPPSAAAKSATLGPASRPPVQAAPAGGGGQPRSDEPFSELQSRFPLALRSPDAPAPWQPLKIGIHRQIAERAPDLANQRGLLRCALGAYLNHPHYLAGLIEGAAR